MKKEGKERVGNFTEKISVLVEGANTDDTKWGYSASASSVREAVSKAKAISREHKGEVVHFSTIHYHPSKRHLSGHRMLQHFRVTSVKSSKLNSQKEIGRVTQSIDAVRNLTG